MHPWILVLSRQARLFCAYAILCHDSIDHRPDTSVICKSCRSIGLSKMRSIRSNPANVAVQRAPRCRICCRASLQAPTDEQQQPHGRSTTRRQLIAGTAAAVVACSTPGLQAAAADTSAYPGVPKVQLAPQLEISKVIKGCWQLSGGHKGERQTDRTSAAAAVEVR